MKNSTILFFILILIQAVWAGLPNQVTFKYSDWSAESDGLSCRAGVCILENKEILLQFQVKNVSQKEISTPIFRFVHLYVAPCYGSGFHSFLDWVEDSLNNNRDIYRKIQPGKTLTGTLVFDPLRLTQDTVYDICFSARYKEGYESRNKGIPALSAGYITPQGVNFYDANSKDAESEKIDPNDAYFDNTDSDNTVSKASDYNAIDPAIKGKSWSSTLETPTLSFRYKGRALECYSDDTLLGAYLEPGSFNHFASQILVDRGNRVVSRLIQDLKSLKDKKFDSLCNEREKGFASDLLFGIMTPEYPECRKQKYIINMLNEIGTDSAITLLAGNYDHIICYVKPDADRLLLTKLDLIIDHIYVDLLSSGDDYVVRCTAEKLVQMKNSSAIPSLKQITHSTKNWSIYQNCLFAINKLEGSFPDSGVSIYKRLINRCDSILPRSDEKVLIKTIKQRPDIFLPMLISDYLNASNVYRNKGKGKRCFPEIRRKILGVFKSMNSEPDFYIDFLITSDHPEYRKFGCMLALELGRKSSHAQRDDWEKAERHLHFLKKAELEYDK